MHYISCCQEKIAVFHEAAKAAKAVTASSHLGKNQ